MGSWASCSNSCSICSCNSLGLSRTWQMGQIGAWLSNNAAAFFLPGEGRRTDRNISWAGLWREIQYPNPSTQACCCRLGLLGLEEGRARGSQSPRPSLHFAASEAVAMTGTSSASSPLGNLLGHNRCSVQSNLDHFISHRLVKVLV